MPTDARRRGSSAPDTTLNKKTGRSHGVLVLLGWAVPIVCLSLALADVGNVPYLLSIAAWSLAMVAVTLRVRGSGESGRKAGTGVWLAPLIAWALLVLAPWTLNIILDRPWPVGLEGFVDSRLPATHTLNLTALAGLCVGLLWLARPLYPPSGEERRPRKWRIALVSLFLVVVYFGSLYSSTGSISSFWRLGTEGAYLQTTAARGAVGYFDLIPTMMVIFVVCLVYLEKRSAGRISLITWALLAITVVVALGLGSRFRLGLLLFGVLAVFWDSINVRHLGRRVRLAVAGVIGALLFIFASGFLSFYRAGTVNTAIEDVIDRFARGIDVLGMQELAVQRGMFAGSLGGESYWELPRQALPRALTEGEKLAPVAQRELGLYLDPQAGFSAPAWFEPWLNFGLPGVFVWSLLFIVGYRLTLKAVSMSRRAPQLSVFAPLWTLIVYQIFSRLLVTLALSTILASLLALAFAFWVVQAGEQSRVDQEVRT